MASTEDPKGAPPPNSETVPGEPTVAYSPTTDASNSYNDDAYSLAVTTPEPSRPAAKSGGGGGSGTPPKPPDDAGDEEDGMLRMSFLEHLEELRSRIIRML